VRGEGSLVAGAFSACDVPTADVMFGSDETDLGHVDSAALLMKLEYSVQIWREDNQFIAHAMPIDVASSGDTV
jgi:hypothetical protein